MNALVVEDLTKVYANGTVALKNIQLAVRKGDFFALLGPNGAGKSTTIGIICSLINKTAGRVTIFGHDIDRELSAAKSLIGIVPQELNFSLFENIMQILIYQAGYYGIPRPVAIQRAEIYLKEMGLWDLRHQQAIRLSGGMKRRLMIARALMNDPQLLILDEPTAGVDIELRHSLWRFLTKLNQQGTTIILTTHYLEEAEHLCKHLAIIANGKIIEHANMKALINRLNVQTLLLDVAKPLSHSPMIAGHECRLVDEQTIEVILHRGQSLNDLFAACSEQHIQITSMRNKTNRLEELFIGLLHDNVKDNYK